MGTWQIVGSKSRMFFGAANCGLVSATHAGDDDDTEDLRGLVMGTMTDMR